MTLLRCSDRELLTEYLSDSRFKRGEKEWLKLRMEEVTAPFIPIPSLRLPSL